MSYAEGGSVHLCCTSVYSTCTGPPTLLNFEGTPDTPTSTGRMFTLLPDSWPYPGTPYNFTLSGSQDETYQYLINQDYNDGAYSYGIHSPQTVYVGVLFTNGQPASVTTTITSLQPFQPIYVYASGGRLNATTIASYDYSTAGDNPACSFAYPQPLQPGQQVRWVSAPASINFKM